MSYLKRVLIQFTTVAASAIVDMNSPVVYHSAEQVLKILEDDRYKKHAGVEELFSAYERKLGTSAGFVKKHPLIVLEGLDGCGKSTISRRLSEKIGAELFKTPPESLGVELREKFDDDKLLRTAFYGLGNYIASFEMTALLESQPVVLDRFWHSTAAYAIAQAVEDYPEQFQMPPEGDPIYKWPEDLMKPDIVLLLNVSEEIRMQRLSRRKVFTKQESLLKEKKHFRENVLAAYARMEGTKVVFVNGNPYPNKVVTDLYDRVKHLLKD